MPRAVTAPALLLAASVSALLAFGLGRASLAAVFALAAALWAAWSAAPRASREERSERSAPATTRSPVLAAAPLPEPPPALPSPRADAPRCRRPFERETAKAGSYPPPLSDDEVFLRAAAGGDVETLRFMLERGQPADTSAVWGESALRVALQASRREAAELLLAAGADPFAVPPGGGSSAFHLLAARGERLELLRRHGADARRDQRDLFGRTPLLEAARCGRLEAARSLLELGADPRARDVYGAGALHHAVGGAVHRSAARVEERRALIALLANAGAPADAPDERGETPRSIAAELGRAELLEALEARRPRGARADLG